LLFISTKGKGVKNCKVSPLHHMNSENRTHHKVSKGSKTIPMGLFV